MIPPAAQRFMSKRAGSTVVEVAVTLIKDAANGIAKEIIWSTPFPLRKRRRSRHGEQSGDGKNTHVKSLLPLRRTDALAGGSPIRRGRVAR
jgi:hypothetical protein